jgi:hypothetical protein
MGKSKGQFQYSQKRIISKKPMKSTRIRKQKNDEVNEELLKLISRCLSIAIYIVSFLILILVCVILGVW